MPAHACFCFPLEQELKCELYQPRGFCLQNLIEGRRADIAVGQMKIGVIQNVEQLRPELKGLGFRQADILGRAKIPIGVAGS